MAVRSGVVVGTPHDLGDRSVQRSNVAADAGAAGRLPAWWDHALDEGRGGPLPRGETVDAEQPGGRQPAHRRAVGKPECEARGARGKIVGNPGVDVDASDRLPDLARGEEFGDMVPQ